MIQSSFNQNRSVFFRVLSDDQIWEIKRAAFDILEKAKVGVSPGIDFGANAEGYLRFSYANSLENIKEGLNRIEKYLKKR